MGWGRERKRGRTNYVALGVAGREDVAIIGAEFEAVDFEDGFARADADFEVAKGLGEVVALVSA